MSLMVNVNAACSAYLVEPPSASKNRRIGVVLLQEWWGLNDYMRRQAERLASPPSAGFTVLVPDLYHGKVAHNEDEASHCYNHLDWSGALKDIQDSVSYLRREKGAKSVAVMGFCMGGALVLASAAKVQGISAGICFYGIPKPEIAKPSDISVPVQLHFGRNDASHGFSDPEALHKLVDALNEHGKEHEVHEYDAGHAFMNETRPEQYNAKVAETAFNRAIDYILRKCAV